MRLRDFAESNLIELEEEIEIAETALQALKQTIALHRHETAVALAESAERDAESA